MNPLTNTKNIKKLSEQELHGNFKTTWHDQYRNSAWIFVGGLPYDLTEGDLLCVFSQYGEVVNINLVRDKDSGKQKGFCFICYEDQRSTDLAVDNLNSIKILSRTIRVDHVSDYKMPKDKKHTDAETKKLQEEGCAPKRPSMPIPSTELPEFAKEIEAPPDGFRLPPRLPIGTVKIEKEDEDTEPKTKKVKVKKEKKHKKDKKKKKSKKKHKKKASSSESSSDDSSSSSENSNSEDEKKSKKKKQKSSESEDKDELNSRKNEERRKKSEEEEERRKNSEELREERKYYTNRDDYLKHKKEGRSDKYERRDDFERRRNDERGDRKREYEKKYKR